MKKIIVVPNTDEYESYAHLPGEEEYCLYHPKTIKRQEEQNTMYQNIKR